MNSATLLLRQVHPTWVQSGRVTSQVFKPTPKDQQRLSVYDGGQITAKDAWGHYTAKLGHKSAGVLAVSVEECQAQKLTAESDPTPFPEHAVIIFDDYTNSQIEKKAKCLRQYAVLRGWQFIAEADNE